ncbi:lysine exporter protein [Dinoroseobacter shibae DFL 12 = DSM 16493]|jgi:L-lysine exporter family protein LysE/ArgO|uniref:Lysine exporter protein n=1 Tax=Dinoroseobacter shibae (strain DSM 16493 / NCIMB 14021 / DFL 12) TaxID=398580 RepID=A8LQH1_DINSH|nr:MULTISPECIES: LysE/ArgO family amino acid transporter [Dinoroseobacter]ABV92457.1 lysine exporter protein [Dinoroseobacter shibae DFL 12 = DSM 16493]MDD9718282.1 LysE/ArgO family amino acid transporter [Dinoroseobacter sp. PD6]URF47402.1 LysE/ArgO family amino acid transporter [Dinoroseobacter shibae]URF51713.1 LysE/ArgO family amino acid transporter [Dinoroseobacter shibae]
MLSPTLLAAGSGFALGLQLIVAIGAQNAFLLRQGLRRSHVGALVVICTLSDAILIAAGVSGFAAIEARMPWLAPVTLWAGAAFLVWYGATHALAAWRGGAALDPARSGAESLRAAVLTCLALTWLNPHVYLDTLVVIGALSAQFGEARGAFGVGAAAASLVFFAALGYGARALSPVFARPRAWQVLDLIIAVTMWALAAKLLIRGVPG